MHISRVFILLIFVVFVSSCKTTNKKSKTLSIEKKDGLLSVIHNNQTLLGYQFGIMYPPKGIDSAYQRSGFIHPLNTLSGHRLTRIHPEDHYHHFGIWNPWTKVLFESDTLDFWNIKSKQATVRYSKFINTITTDEYLQYETLHEHVVLKNNKNKVALNELQTVRIYNPNEDYYNIDLTFNYSCATESEFKILAHRYQGLGWRATKEWNNFNSEIITSEGKTRLDADNTIARWFIYQGELGNDYGGMAILSHTQNYSHPEPIRVWPKDNHEGNVFANFVPTKYKDWLFEPNKTYTLKYRLIVFNDKFTKEQAETQFQLFSKL